MSTFTLTERQLGILRSAADRIVPPDETIGACEAGAAEFILRLLSDELAAQQSVYVRGLDAIDLKAVERFGGAFVGLGAAEQDAVLREIECSHASFFRMLVEHVLEGFYADQANGGNRGAASWKMIGYCAEGGTW
jgi:gluconate 2-dehydrogenase gamma chain